MKKAVSIIFFLFVSCVIATAQIYPTSIYMSGNGKPRTAKEMEEMKRLFDSRSGRFQMNEMNRITNGSFGKNSSSKYSKELMSKAKKYVAAPLELQNKYADFLRQPHTGIVKLLSAEPCSSVGGSNKKEKDSDYLKRCASDFIRGNGRYFSFRQNEYVVSDLSDIGFVDNWFFSLGLMNQGILTVLGDVDIQSLSLNSKSIDYIAGFNPSTVMDEASKEYGQFENVLKVNDSVYGKVVEIRKDQTYALRVVAYNGYYLVEGKQKKTAPDKLFFLNEDKREDVVVIFRVIERNENDSVVILWKELQRKQAPEIMVSTTEGD